IRDFHVTGVQTCALPISRGAGPVSAESTGETAGMSFVRGRHYAYQHRSVTHLRMIVLTPRNSWVVIDSLSGKGKHLVESFIHFHPAVRVENVNNPARSAVGTASERWAIQFDERRYFL